MNLDPIAPRTEPFANLSSHALRCGHDCYSDPTGPELWLDPGMLHDATIEIPKAVRGGGWRSCRL